MRTFPFFLAATLIAFMMPSALRGGVNDHAMGAATTPPPSPRLLEFSENLCESDWLNVTYSIANPDPALEYIWSVPSVLDFDISDTGDRLMVEDMSPLLTVPFERIVVQAKNDCGTSVPTVLNIRLIGALDIPALPRDTFCVDRAFSIDPFRDNVGGIESWEWEFGLAGDISSGEPELGERFAAQYNREGRFIYTQTVIDKNVK